MKLKLIACKVLTREISFLIANSKNFIDTTFLRQGYHNTPDLLREILQEEINRIDSGDDRHSADNDSIGEFDAILLGYGLCSNGIVGLSSKKYKIIVPKAHDCITLFLGSKEMYKNYFDSHSGIYWYTPGWIENTLMPSKNRFDQIRQKYIEQYGEENADYLMEMEQNWVKEYSYATYVGWNALPFKEYEEYTKSSAALFDWSYDYICGETKLMEDFLNGKWDENRFLIVPPNKKIAPSYDNEVLTTED